MPHSLFAYGTLMAERIMRSVSGLSPSATAAVLQGYRRGLIREEVYPGIRPDPHGLVEGLLYPELGSHAWERLDAFEGELYRRETVEVALRDGARVWAQTYVLKPAYYPLLTSTPWTLERFMRSGLSSFVTAYRGFGSLED